jgi:hypothetical protein
MHQQVAGAASNPKGCALHCRHLLVDARAARWTCGVAISISGWWSSSAIRAPCASCSNAWLSAMHSGFSGVCTGEPITTVRHANVWLVLKVAWVLAVSLMDIYRVNVLTCGVQAV